MRISLFCLRTWSISISLLLSRVLLTIKVVKNCGELIRRLYIYLGYLKVKVNFSGEGYLLLRTSGASHIHFFCMAKVTSLASRNRLRVFYLNGYKQASSSGDFALKIELHIYRVAISISGGGVEATLIIQDFLLQ